MSDQYTPTTETVEAIWEERTGDTADFRTWLASVKAEAWDEGYDEPRECCGMCPLKSCPWDNGNSGPTNPYRETEIDDG